MKYDKEIHHKSSIRLNGHDYSSSGYYFITICTKDRECIFGDIDKGKMKLSNIGKIAHNEWLNTSNLRKNVILDEFIVMPNHIHMIIEITKSIGSNQIIRKFGPQSNNLFSIIRGFKGSTTKQANKLLDNPENGSIWQSRFYDHVIKTEVALN